MRVFSIAILSFGALAGCANLAADKETFLTKSDIVDFVEIMQGKFETLPDNTDAQILDRRVLIDSPFLDGYWFYSQLNTGPDKKVYRQRVSNIAISADNMSIIQKSYTLNTPEKYTEFWGQNGMFNTLSQKDLERFANEGCVQKWTRVSHDSWTGYVDPKTCIIRSKRRNVDIRIEAEAKIDRDTYLTNERGFDVDMEQIWGSKPGEFITLKRNP